MSAFKKATRTAAKLRIGMAGPSGSGKTYTAIRLAAQLGKRIAVIDTERGSASLYEGEQPDGVPFAFDVLELHSFEPANYEQAIRLAVNGGYDVIIIDSLSHAWNGVGGMLEQVDRAGGQFGAWRNVTPQHNRLVDALLTADAHVIFTLRTKTEYVVVENARGKKEPQKIGLAPVFRDGIEYESTVFLDLDVEHNAKVSKTRCAALDGRTYHKPGPDLARPLIDWLAGAPTPIAPPAPAVDPDAHDPSWSDDQRRFFGKLKDVGVEYEPLKAFLALKGHPKPSAMTQTRRVKLLEALVIGHGLRSDFDGWLAATTADAAAK